MAVMIPDDVDNFCTDGERQFYGFLKNAAKPDSKYLAWYLPDINGREPDFILFCRDTGLIIFEVKDWTLNQIQEANPQHFTLSINGYNEERESPLKQARTYCHILMDKIRDDRRLLSRDPQHAGNPKIPIHEGVVFPNINKYEYIQKAFDQVIHPEQVFFWDDLHPQSDICRDTSGQSFSSTLQKMFTTTFRFNLTPDEMQHLRQLLFPMIRIEMPDRAKAKERQREEDRIRLLDHNQESIARKFDGGHRIISGPSGSGKTLVLVHRAAILKQYNPAIKRILFVCYNVTLVNFIKRLLTDKKVPLGENGVEVVHFFELCEKILCESVTMEKEEMAYYDLIIEEALKKAKDYPEKYDAILVDEGQDFSDDMYRIVVCLLNPATNHLAISLDDNQNIYRRKQTWNDLGIQVRGRVHRLSWVYRNTRTIADFARKFLNEKEEKAEQLSPQMDLFQNFITTTGPEPEITKYPSLDELISNVATQIDHLHNEDGYPLSEIAIIYTQKSPDHLPGIHLPDLMIKAFEKQGLYCNWIAEDYRAKRSYDVTTQSVTISTIHSVKGFDYACVFVIGLDWLDGTRWSEEQIRNLTYVAITRARERLYIPHVFNLALAK
ncbi:MAG: hypothetical protein CVU54_14480 [Deltaproteobacteria bacterium HGW-Deltaproteobacteria-12]|jgi:hypothetical protein|nr:MAG: hypothetical protein CVU54_14480 [Deltaproteobacteria bacterium HGW-Deltaproteobacteria-12]